MKKSLLMVIGILVVLLAASIPAGAAAEPESYVVLGAGEVLPDNFESLITAAGGTIESTLPQIGVAFVSSSNPNFAKARIPGVVGIGINPTLQFLDPVQNIAFDQEFGNPPNSGDDDFFFDLQWGHDAVNAPEAWEAGYRGAGVRVAVLDGGFDLDHPDLAPNINLALSMDFTGEGLQYTLPDTFSHGTHTAGTIGAADNAFGTIGVAPEVDLVLVKVLSDSGSGSFADVISGIVYAADVDADVINMSLGAYIPRSGETASLMVAQDRATSYAYRSGTTVFASAGNGGYDMDKVQNFIHVPSSSVNVISISATTPLNWAGDPANADFSYLASYSNYGQKAIDFAAPGGSVDYPGNEGCVVAGLARPCWVFDLVFSTGNGGWYWSAGTSMASPHAAGVAALIIGANGGEMHPAQVEAALAGLAADYGKPGNDDAYGLGFILAPTE